MTDPYRGCDDDALAALLRQAWRDEAPPRALVARVIGWRRAQRQAAGRAAAALRQLFAVALGGDTTSALAPAWGVRGTTGRQWLYHTAECEIDVRIVARGQGFAIVGQLFGALAAERVCLSGAAGELVAPLDATREFVFADLPAGRYRLAVQAGEVEIVVPQLDVA